MSTPALSPLTLKAFYWIRVLNLSSQPLDALKSFMFNWRANSSDFSCKIGPDSCMDFSLACLKQSHIKSLSLSNFTLLVNRNFCPLSLLSYIDKYSDLRFKMSHPVVLPTPNFPLRNCCVGFGMFSDSLIKSILSSRVNSVLRRSQQVGSW